MNQKSCIVNGLHCKYLASTIKVGQPTLVWLHGWGDRAETFTDIIASMHGAYNHIAVQLPGFGGSQAPQIPWGVSDYAAFVGAFLDKLTLRDVVLIGHSNGGAMVVKLAAEQPALISRVILIAASGIRSTAEQRLHRQAFKLLAKSGRIITKPLGDRARTKLKNQLYKKAGSDYLLVPHMQETFKKVVAEDVRNAAQHVLQPSLLIWGDADAATPVFMGKAYKQLLSDATLHIILGGTHFVHQEQSAVVAAYVEDFIAS